MDHSNKLTRRQFIKLTTMASVGASPLIGMARPVFDSHVSGNEELSIYIFSKHLQFLDYVALSNEVKEMGFEGIDLTVRPRGHVFPERVSDDLPRVTEAMRSVGLKTQMFTSNVKDAASSTDQEVLKVASKLGYDYYRTGWFKYNKNEDIQLSLNGYKKNLRGLARLNKKLGIGGSYHNHSGHYMGASLWDLKDALEGLSPKYMGAQYDIMHATVEGGKNWEIEFRLIKDHINTLVVKDFVWGKEQGKWKPIHTQLGEGMVDFKRYFSLLKQNGINVPLSLHCEYDLGGAEKGGIPSIPKEEVFRMLKKDLTFLRRTWAEAE